MSKTRVLYLALFTVLVLSFQNCGNPAQFTAASSQAQSQSIPGGGGSGATTTTSCAPITQQTTENLRIIFMVDNSGSTAQTDPNDTYRVKVLQTFLTDYGSKTNFNYGFGWFAPDEAIWDMSKSQFLAQTSSPIGTAAGLSNALTAFSKLGTSTLSGTYYNLAFSTLQTMIDTVAKTNDGWNYAIVFMSDGQPTDLPGNGTTQATAIAKLVTTLTADVVKYNSLISVSSVYFGPESDSQSINNLQVMATTGGGQFVDTNKVTNLAISDLVTIPGQVCTTN